MGVMVKEKVREKVVDVRMVSDRVMTLVVVFEEDVLSLICGYAPQREEVWRPAWVTLMDMLLCILVVFIGCMEDMVEEALTELQNSPNGMSRLVEGLKTDSKEVEGV